MQPTELSPLPSTYEIFLDYVLDKKSDANGNLFRYRGHLRDTAKKADHKIYNVELTIDPQ